MTDSAIQNILSFFMVISSLTTLGHLIYYNCQTQRERKVYTIDRLEGTFKKIEKFYIDSKNIGKYTKQTVDCYREIVDPYLTSLLFLYIQVDSKLLDKKYLEPYLPILKANYNRIKDYIKHQRNPPNTPEAWEEIDLLNKLLGINNN